MYTARVFGRMAASTASGRVASTKVTSMPSRLNVCPNSVSVPPYRAAAETICCPAWARLNRATLMACCPLLSPSAPTPPSRAARRCSNTSVVGFISRVYIQPISFKAKRSAACCVSRKQ